MIVPQNGGSGTYPPDTSSGAAARRCRESFGRMVRLTGTLEKLTIGRLLTLVHAFDATDWPRATARRFCLPVLPAGRILSRFFGGPNSRTRRIADLSRQSAEGRKDHGTAAEELCGRVVRSWFRRICRGCGLLFWRWEKHDCAACLKRGEWREQMHRTLAAKWEAARRPPMRDTTEGFVWKVACRCGCHSVELTEEGAMCARCGMPGPSGIAWGPRGTAGVRWHEPDAAAAPTKITAISSAGMTPSCRPSAVGRLPDGTYRIATRAGARRQA